MEFDPLDPSTWKKPESMDDPEHREYVSSRINTIIAESADWNALNDLCRMLEGYKPNLSFHRRIRRDADYKALVDWIVASDARRERAALELRKHLRLKKCSHCGTLVDETELEPPPAFDWGEFAGGE